MSKNVKCINPKTYSLTKGKEYNLLEGSDDNTAIIFNDRGLKANYNIKLFEKADLSDAEVLASYKVEFGESDEDPEDSIPSVITMTNKSGEDLKITINQVNKTIESKGSITTSTLDIILNFNISEPSASCSILSVDGLDNLADYVEHIANWTEVEAWPENQSQNEFINKLFMDIIKCLANQYVETASFILLSTVVENNCVLRKFDLLNDYASQQNVAVNPNTENEVTVWLIPINAFDA